MDISKLRKAVDTVCKVVTPPSAKDSGKATDKSTHAKNSPHAIFWANAEQKDNRMLYESICGLQECLEALRQEWVSRNEDLPVAEIPGVRVMPGQSKENLEVKLVPALSCIDWYPQGKRTNLGFQLITTDDCYEVDEYPEDPTAYPI